MTEAHNRLSADSLAPPADLADRIELYLDDAPSDGAHSDKAGGNCWELLREAMEELRAVAQGCVNCPVIKVIDGFTRGAFTGWAEADGNSQITLDEAEDHFSLCMADMMDAAREAAAQPPAAPVETEDGSYCDLCDSEHDLHEDGRGFHHVIKGERVACCAHPRSSAASDPDGWIVERPGDSTFPRLYRSKAEADAMVAYVNVNPGAAASPLFKALPQSAQVAEAIAPCKGEHSKFEEWAAAEKYDMQEHPIHYLFTDPKTYAARQGWKAALRYVSSLLTRPESR